MLAFAGHSSLTADRDLTHIVDEPFAAQARALIEQRAGLELWGWKDPRTCLFLPFWDRLLPEARYVFVYRHPVEVALSLLRRDSEPEPRADPWVAIRCWEVYNRCVLDFRRRHPGRCFVAHVPTFTRDLTLALGRLASKLALPLRPVAPGLYVDEELAPSPERRVADWDALIPRAMGLYRELEACADLPSSLAVPAFPPEPANASARDRQRYLRDGGETLLYRLLAERLTRESLSRLLAAIGGSPAEEPRHALDLANELAASRRSVATLQEAIAAAQAALAAAREGQRASEEARQRSEGALQRNQEARRQSEEALGGQLELAMHQTEVLAAALAEIRSSRSFAAVEGWWALRKRLRRA
jgi:hypothetical protein